MNIALSSKPILQTHIQTQSEKDWNAIIKYQAKLKNDTFILSTYMQMESLGISPNHTTLPLVFKACTRLNAFERGKKIHSSIKGTNFIHDIKVSTAVVDFYCKCGHVNEAIKVFGETSERDLVMWNAMISGYVECGCYEDAIWLFKRMQMEGFEPNSRTLVGLILACEGLLELGLGKEIHGYCLRNGCFDLYPHVGTVLIGFYLNFDVRKSSLVFDMMIVRSAVSWNAMLTGYFDAGDVVKALELFILIVKDGIQIDMVTLLVVIQATAEFGSLELSMQIHHMAIKLGYADDLFIQNALLNMYAEIGELELACQLFDALTYRDIALWNSMISAYIDYACYEEAISLFSTMRTQAKEDERTIVAMLSMCANLPEGLKMGKSLHGHAYKSRMMMDISVGNALLSMYADYTCGKEALNVFNEINDVDVVSFNATILALSGSDLRSEAWKLFGIMRESLVSPNSHTMISLLTACGDKTCLNIGRSIHGFVIKQGIETSLSLNTSLTDMYMNCGDEATAMYLFETCPDKDLVSWNAMIAAFLKNNNTNEALMLFNDMISEVEPNAVTIINVISTCTDLANLPLGQCLHAYAAKRYSPFSSTLSLANALITMYARCGSIQNAEKIFKTLQNRNIISWNAIIAGYSTHGSAYDAICAYTQMLEEGFRPNGVTFLSVLSACRHAGLIEKGLQVFASMVEDFRVTPMLAHYGCVVDLLGRGGHLNEGREFIKAMPVEPDATVWRALLNACRVHSNTKLATEVFEHLVKLEPENAGNCVLLSNIYAEASLWSEATKIRAWLKENGLKKTPGMSWIVVRGQVHSFTAGDTSHPQSQEIYDNINSLVSIMRESGYVTDFSSSLDNEEGID